MVPLAPCRVPVPFSRAMRSAMPACAVAQRLQRLALLAYRAPGLAFAELPRCAFHRASCLAELAVRLHALLLHLLLQLLQRVGEVLLALAELVERPLPLLGRHLRRRRAAAVGVRDRA